MTERLKRSYRHLLLLLLILMLCWIWGNSMVPTDMSRRISNKFKNEVRPLYYAIVGQPATPTPKPTVTLPPASEVTKAAPPPSPTPIPAKPKDVRKYAHFTEFAALGILAALFALTYRSASVQRSINVLSFGLAVAVTDESIQILSGRGPEVQDILLDCAGYAAGVAVIALLGLLHKLAVHSRNT